MGFGQNFTRSDPGVVDANTVDNGIRAGKIDVFKNAQLFRRRAAVGCVGMDAGLIKGENLTGQQIPLKLRAHSMKGAAFRGDNVGAVLHFSVAQRAEAMGIPHGDELGGGHHDQRKSALQPVHRPADRRLDGLSGDSLPGNHIGDGLRVGGGVENGAGQLQLPPELKRVA